MGGILDGMPPRFQIDFEAVRKQLSRRAPGSGQPGVSARQEPDEPEFLSGLSADGLTLGSPIAFIVRNRDARPSDYNDYQGKFRPNHADFTYYKKYGIHDFRGGGRASARETVSWVIAGSICRQWLEKEFGITFRAISVETNSIQEALERGDSTGGIVSCAITGLPIGVGEPVFDKLHARLAAAMMSINAAKAFEYGDGALAASSFGSEQADIPVPDGKGGITFASNHSGGIQGGISNGMPVIFSVYFKPAPTIMQPQASMNTAGEKVTIYPRGRHDACVALRALPVVEAMAALTIADLLR